MRGSRMRRGSGPPAWLVFLLAVALVFGAFYIVRGLQNFLVTGGRGVDESTAQAQLVETATAERVTRAATLPSGIQILPTGTPLPACIPFRVTVPNAIVRAQPSASGAIVTGLTEGQEVCVIGRAAEGSEWYEIDSNPVTRRLEIAYMHQDVIDAVNPTLTPTRTPTPLPSVTPAPTSRNPSPTVRPTATHTELPDFRPTLPSSQEQSATPPVTVSPGSAPDRTATDTPQPAESGGSGLAG